VDEVNTAIVGVVDNLGFLRNHEKVRLKQYLMMTDGRRMAREFLDNFYEDGYSLLQKLVALLSYNFHISSYVKLIFHRDPDGYDDVPDNDEVTVTMEWKFTSIGTTKLAAARGLTKYLLETGHVGISFNESLVVGNDSQRCCHSPETVEVIVDNFINAAITNRLELPEMPREMYAYRFRPCRHQFVRTSSSMSRRRLLAC
jgi:hypothetical protein